MTKFKAGSGGDRGRGMRWDISPTGQEGARNKLDLSPEGKANSLRIKLLDQQPDNDRSYHLLNTEQLKNIISREKNTRLHGIKHKRYI